MAEPLTPTREDREGQHWAELFHDTYERLAPSFGYETRQDTKRFDPTSANGRLMIAVCGEVASRARVAALEEAKLQPRVQPWMMACFGPEISADKVERGDRLLEEVFELLQSGGYDPCRIAALASYTWNRPPGEPSQEVGGVMITLAAYCLAHGLDMHEAGERELARISAPETIEKIRRKQAAKAAIDMASPLPDAAAIRSLIAKEGSPTPSPSSGEEKL